MFIGNRLKNIRTSKKMTQTELGNMINVTKVSICCYEKGTRTPSLETLNDLCLVFGVDLNYFFGKDIAIVKEDSPNYEYYVSNEEIELLNELRMNKNLYKMLIESPKRIIELIDKKLK